MSGRVYFIKNQRGHVKIGFTAGAAGNRLRTLQTGAETRLEVLAVAVGDRALERDLHDQFSAVRLTGEWFDFSDGLEPLFQVIDGLHRDESIPGSRHFSTPNPTQSVVKCQSWVRAYCEYVTNKTGCAKIDAHRALAEEAGIAPGTVENLMRGRLVSVDVETFDRIKEARIASAERELSELHAELEERRRAKALTAPIPALVDHAISQALATARAGLEMLRMPALATARKLMERS